MDDKKSVPSNNQVENHEKDIQFDNDMHENGDSSNIMQYGRDILLHLRLHPMSLQKPVNLPEIEVVKDKLHLHDVVDSTASVDKNMDLSSYQSSLKSDYCNLKHEYPYYSHYFNRLNPYSYPYMFNRPYQNASSKFRSAFHTYCNAFKKPCVSKDSCYKNFSDESLWTKQCYLTSDDVWTCYPSHVHSNHTKSKEDVNAIPKSRKKLSIIDPITGKNILDGVTPTPSETDRDMCAAQTNLKCSENDISSGEKYAGDYFCCTAIIDEFKEVPKDFSCSYTEDGVFSENEKDIFIDQTEYVDKQLKDASEHEGTSNKTSSKFSSDADCDVNDLCDSETTENAQSGLKSCQNKKSTIEADKPLSRQLPKFYQAKELKNTNIHGNCLVHGKKGCNPQISKENVLKESDFVRDNLRQLKEKINTLTQEHQKMAILQSFLRYKKFKLEETARNLDEKRIEIANWECNLLKKAKGLLEKEQWLNSKGEKLQCKEQQLAEWEKSLNKEIKKEASDNFQNYGNDEKESQFSERKYGLDNCSKAPWDEVPVSNKYRGEDNEEFPYFSSTPTRIGNNVSVERCVSDAASLDELEKNIIFMEKIGSPSETNNSSFDNKLEHVPFNVGKKKDDIPSCDPLGYSKGRRYLPEHMKYWLNKRDRSGM